MDREEDVASGKDEHQNDVEIQDRPNSNDSELDRNQEDDAVRGEHSIEASNVITCTNNIEIINASNVTIGDHNTIDITVPPFVRQSGERMNTLRISEGFQAMVETGDRDSVDEETQISERPVVINIIGDNNVINICVQSSDQIPASGVRVREVFIKMCEIVNLLHPLRDYEKWLEFGDALNGLHQKYDSHPEIKCFLLLEESVTLTYQKKFKAANKKVKESLNNVRANSIDGALQDVLTALANIALASIYRQLPKQKPAMAFRCLQNAMESGERLKRIDNLTIPNFVLARLDYEQARFRMEFAAVKSDTTAATERRVNFLDVYRQV